MVDLAADLNLVEKSGAWFSFQGERIGQGRENAKAYMEQHPELLDKLEGMILAKHGIKRGGPAAANGAAHPDEAASEEKGSAKARPTAKPAN